MKKTTFILPIIIALFVITSSAFSQGVSINDDGSDPDESAILDLKKQQQRSAGSQIGSE